MQTWDPDFRSEVNTDFFLTWDYFFPNLDCEYFIFSVTVRKCAREVVRDTKERSRSFTLHTHAVYLTELLPLLLENIAKIPRGFTCVFSHKYS